MKTYRDNYPCGRKFCQGCKHWRHVVDFSVRVWADKGQTVPRILQARCHACVRIYWRIKRGYDPSRPREWYPHGIPGSEKWLERRRVRNRAVRARLRKNPEWRERMAEYKRFWRNAKNGQQARVKDYKPGDVFVDRKPFVDLVESLPLSPAELSELTGLSEAVFGRKSGQPTIRLSTVDKVLFALGLEDQVAVLWRTGEAA